MLFAEGTPDVTTVGGAAIVVLTVIAGIVKIFLAQLDKKDAQVVEMFEHVKELAVKFDGTIKDVTDKFSADLRETREEGRRINDRLFEANTQTVEVMSEMKSALQTLTGRVDHLDKHLPPASRKTQIRERDPDA